jgi:hypothetical protein
MPEDSDLLAGIVADLKRDMKDGFDGVRSDVKEMVTKGEFKAEVGRLDANHSNLKQSHTDHVALTEKARAEDKAANRWTLGFAVTIVGVAVAVINAIWK